MVNRLRFSARSDIGLQRTGNEDSGFADSHLLMVADGMGGHAAGELASAMAVATFAEIDAGSLSDEEVLESMADGVDQLTERIGDVIAADPANQGMGTTVTGMHWHGDRVGIVHVGDSRAYRLRDGQLSQITKDHTYVQTLVDSGEITPEMAASHPRRNLLIRAVDGIHPVEADLSMRETKAGDRYLLCSDGLTGVVSDDRIAEVLKNDADPTGAVTRLVDMALEGGAPDNVTVVIADVLQGVREGSSDRLPVVVGAAGEPANRAKLPNVPWPVDEQLDPDDPRPRQRATTVPEPERPTQPIAVVESPTTPDASRSRWVKVAAAVVASFVLLLAIVGAALLWWLGGQWYVADLDGRVTVFHGVPGTLGPIPLQVPENQTDTEVAALPSYDQSRVETGIPTTSLEVATGVANELAQRAAECQVNPKLPGCPDSPEAGTGEGSNQVNP
ncbi:MAG: protein phosphatase 2C domain-containing protein [Actinomycetia bacterium]|nr:protein phosphatase 2C domain-containing protein [Actinomycetes bacterium]